MRPVPVWEGHISDDGRFGLLESEKPARVAYFRTLAGKRVDITVREHRSTRSIRANNYYWSCVLEPMSQDTSAGDASAEDIHDAMCQRFLPDEKKRVAFFNQMTGENMEIETDGRRSSRLQGDEFYDFVEKVRKFALEWMQLRTEDPDPQYWRKRLTTERAA